MTDNIGKCERCEDNGVALVAISWEQHFGLEPLTHCQVCADILDIKRHELSSAFTNNLNYCPEYD